jgi:two-component system cell cycle response regulator CtrA
MNIALHTDNRDALAQVSKAVDDPWQRQNLVDLAGVDLLVIWSKKFACLGAVKQVRGSGNDVPIICVVDHDTTPREAREIFEAGADDLMRVAIDPRELRARVGSVMRRVNMGQDPRQLICGDITIEPENKRVFGKGRLVRLTGQEYALLEAMALGVKRKGPLYRTLYSDNTVAMKILDVFICKIRRKLEDLGVNPLHVQTIWGMGYTLNPDPEEIAVPNRVKVLNSIGVDWSTVSDLSARSGVPKELLRYHLQRFTNSRQIEHRTTLPLAYRLPPKQNLTHQGEAA